MESRFRLDTGSEDDDVDLVDSSFEGPVQVGLDDGDDDLEVVESDFDAAVVLDGGAGEDDVLALDDTSFREETTPSGFETVVGP